jgi:hypothetical protein
MNCQITFGSTVATSLTFGARIGAGADFDAVGFVTSVFTANQILPYTIPFMGTPSNTSWAGAGSVINLTANPGAQAVQIGAVRSVIMLLRAPDQ